MNQCSWTYVDDAGQPHRVGLAHGATSGHLLVHVNARIALIDFNVLDTSNYSIFINEELFNIGIERKGQDFRYAFEIDKKADTPRNRQRKEQEKQHWRQTLAVAGGLLVAVLLAVLLLQWNQKPDQSDRMAILVSNKSGTTAGQVLGEKGDLHYVFIARGRTYKEPLDAQRMQESAYFPVEAGDQFMVRYDPNNPELNVLDYEQPTSQQLEEYRKEVFERHKRLHPEQSDLYIRCQLSVAERLRGVEGLALFYYQNVEPAKAEDFNSLTYKKFIRDLPFKNALRRNCWKE